MTVKNTERHKNFLLSIITLGTWILLTIVQTSVENQWFPIIVEKQNLTL